MLTILSFFLWAGIISLYLRWPSEVMSFGSLLSYWKLLGSFKTYLNYNSLSIIHLETYRAKSSFLSFFLTQYSFSSKNIYMTMHKMAKRPKMCENSNKCQVPFHLCILNDHWNAYDGMIWESEQLELMFIQERMPILLNMITKRANNLWTAFA